MIINAIYSVQYLENIIQQVVAHKYAPMEHIFSLICVIHAHKYAKDALFSLKIA